MGIAPVVYKIERLMPADADAHGPKTLRTSFVFCHPPRARREGQLHGSLPSLVVGLSK